MEDLKMGELKEALQELNVLIGDDIESQLSEKEEPACSLCDETEHQLLIEHKGIYICDECVKLSFGIINDHEMGF